MQPGNQVKSKNHPEYGVGKIIDKTNIFNEDYYQVFFEKMDKPMQLIGNDLELVLDPFTMFKQGMTTYTEKFKLKTLAHQLETFYFGHNTVSPTNFKIKPLPHQLLALDFVLNQFKPRCLLADEVGLGKTIEAALIFEELKMRGIANKVLIITPAGLTHQWQEEMRLKFSEDFYLMDKEKARALFELHGQEGNIWDGLDQVITSIDFLKPKKIHDDLGKRARERREEHNQRIYQACLEADWDMVIIDEAHKLTKYKSGEETARYKLGSALAEITPIFLLLTATPHSGKPHVFKNLLQLIDLHLFYKVDDLKPANVEKVTVRNKKRAAVDMEGNRLFKSRITSTCEIDRNNEKDKVERLLYEEVINYVSEYYNYAKFEKNQVMIFLLMLYQRIVCSSSQAILSSLEKRYNTLQQVEKISRILNSDFSDFEELSGEEQLDLIEKNQVMLKDPRALKKEMNIIKDCIEVARKCVKGHDDAKLRKLLEIIDEVKRRENNPDTKMIIFTEFVETQNYILDSLETLGYQTAYINGRLGLEEKIEQKNKFKDEAQFLVSTDAGGEGINLQFCSYMVNYDIPWNPMKLEQRIGRIDRIGQKQDVKIFNFVLKDTIEEYVRETLEGKLELIKEQFGEDKLRDILSTLQEDFNFDKIYFDAVIERQKEAEKLEDIAEKMYDQAEEILKQDEFLIPFTDDDKNIGEEERRIMQDLPERIKRFISDFLISHGEELKEYSNQEDIYYFKNDFKTENYQKHFSQVIFSPEKGINSEEAELFSLKNEYVRDVIADVKKQGRVTGLEVNDSRFTGKEGLLSFWQLTIENNYDYSRKYYIPIFIEEAGRHNSRLSRLFKRIDDLDIKKGSGLSILNEIEELYQEAEETAQKRGENLFLENKLEWEEKINERMKQLKTYYQEKEKAIKEIKVDNIRKGRMQAMQEKLSKEEQELKDKRNLFPKLTCEQLAYVKFGG